ncbi:PREDICTED: EKC/KEOPS complex subunit bud32 isoform X2 [Ceratosolen solmsi marchali]|uniref:non-specific serine/threonine protein kinase n=1 Tax=Ceratosolen solmsi marchali TaxID=326594 RepID=A0AAJ6VK98_9HYME|nr:PREDICTED: EKC/KEOPS complex subunit bud32 isoform X2 [Ceratosolen solmsi marchali]
MVYKIPDFELISQGAEARLYKGVYLGKLTVIKERFEKKYRHIELDLRLTKERIRAEVRAIVRAKLAGVSTPAIYLVDFRRRSIFMQYIENAIMLKTFIEQYVYKNNSAKNLIEKIMGKLGQIIVNLHLANIVHGDLTTSNILIKNVSEVISAEINHKLVLIDFGLARVESTAEDAAVDLFVLERSLMSAHAELPELFEIIYTNYKKFFSNKSRLKEIIIKYKDVKARGRKRTMIG